MPFLPIVGRELNVIASRAAVRWVRVALVAVTGFLCLQWFAASAFTGHPDAAGRGAFRALSAVAFVLACATAFLTADCVSAERREGTLGLLFLTDLKGHDVVLGKLVSMGINSLYALAGFAPVLMLTLVAGGVTAGEVARTALALISLMFVSLTVGLLVSVRLATRIETMSVTAVLLLFLLLAPWVPTWLGIAPRFFLSEPLSPAYAFFTAGDTNNAGVPTAFWSSLVCAQLEGGLLLVIASTFLLNHWRDVLEIKRVRSSHGRRRLARVRANTSAATASPVVPRYAFRSFSPVAYAVLRSPGCGAQAWSAALILFVASLANAAGAGRVGTPVPLAGASTVLALIAAGIFAWVGGRFFFEAKRSGELELLLPTPLGASGIIRDQWLALARWLRGPLLLVVFGTVPFAANQIVASEGMELLGVLAALFTAANAVLGIVAVCSVGMWFGTRASRPLAVAGWSVGLVEIAATIGAYLAAFVVTAAGPIPGGGNVVVWSLLLPVLLLGKNLFFIWWSHGRLRNEFHTAGFWNFARSLDSPRRGGVEPPGSTVAISTGSNSPP